ncbi:high-affinity choline transporter 1-like [Antennarius striatus]|uniref:high-affinity choline transporter 1-like n=1 Tax=Antennarius striatus TaxID=241820 RepID=UPI0035ADC05C
MVLLGNRSINWVVGVFTMTATWIGGNASVGSVAMMNTPSMGLIRTSESWEDIKSDIMAVNVPGVIAMVVFYLLVLGTGIWASFKSKRKQKRSGATGMEMVLLGNRSINQVVGVFTMTATWIGGSIIVGSVEMMCTPSMGLIRVIVLFLSYSSTFVIGGLLFVKPLREGNCLTMLDSFHIKYGKVITAGMSLLSVFIDAIWVNGTLTSLGGTMSVVLDLPFSLCVWISAAVVIIYTLMGGLYSVAYTDVIQLVLILGGLR